MSIQPYQVTAINAFNDNYIWLISHANNNYCVVVDPGDSAPVIEFIKQHELELEAILITHHHNDHVGGVADLLDYAGKNVPVYGPIKEANDVVTHAVCAGDTIQLQAFSTPLNVLEVPGHTLGHIAFQSEFSVFCGDTLFSAGCGRMFEGTPTMFQQSLADLAALPAQTKVYCAHEYTLANLAFAKAVSPNCDVLAARLSEAQALRQQGLPTIPTTIEIERATNPFLRLGDAQIQAAIANNSQAEITDDLIDNFAALRRWKDDF